LAFATFVVVKRLSSILKIKEVSLVCSRINLGSSCEIMYVLYT